MVVYCPDELDEPPIVNVLGAALTEVEANTRNPFTTGIEFPLYA